MSVLMNLKLGIHNAVSPWISKYLGFGENITTVSYILNKLFRVKCFAKWAVMMQCSSHGMIKFLY